MNFNFSALLDLLILPFKEAPTPNPPAPENKMPHLVHTPARELANLKAELSETFSQIKTLQSKSATLANLVENLERRQAAEEGPTVYRADRGPDSIWSS